MKKTIRILVTLALALVASSSMASICFGWETDLYYFSDAAMLNQTGEFDNFCDGGNYSWGTTDVYRMRDRIPCCHSGGSHTCAQFVNGSWQPMTCPY